MSEARIQDLESGGGSEGSDTQTRNYAILDQLLRDCCVELMADYGLPALLAAPSALSEPVIDVSIAAIDFSGRDLRGTIGLRMTSSVVLETYRAAVGVPIQENSPEANDWTCELVNQLIGRLKNKLRSYNVSFNVNTPRLLSTFPVDELDRGLRSRFVSDRGPFAGYLDVMIAPGFVFVDSPPEEPLIDEGDLVLF
ncbi:MAG: chemotaxis protein CheX [Deltaproteobacteria bacterium]